MSLGDYDSFVLDVDGVVLRGGHPIPEAAEGLRLLARRGARLAFASNNTSADPLDIRAKLEAVLPGEQTQYCDALDAVEEALPDDYLRRPSGCYAIGTPAMCSRLQSMGWLLLDPTQAESARVVVVGSTTHFDYRMLRTATTAVRRGALLCCTGRERWFIWRDEFWPSTGAIVAAIEASTGLEALVFGKPEPLILHMASRHFARDARVLAVGDDAEIDIRAARAAGVGSALVLTGITGKLGTGSSGWKPDFVATDLRDLALRWSASRSEP